MGVACVKSDTEVATTAYQDHSYYVPIVKMISSSTNQIVAFYVWGGGGGENMAGSQNSFLAILTIHVHTHNTSIFYCQNANPAVRVIYHVHVFKYVCVMPAI